MNASVVAFLQGVYAKSSVKGTSSCHDPTTALTIAYSAVGKTQFVLSLLLAAQLPPPHGLGKRTLYLSTESSLNTVRLNQILQTHSQYLNLPLEERPSTDNILTVNAHNLEKQEHVTIYQLPEAVRRYDVGLVVIDSVAANFRVEFQGASPKVLGERAVALVRLGRALRKIAHEHNVAIVCTNQVADRFDDDQTRSDKFRYMSSQSQSSSQATQKLPEGRLAPRQENANSAARMQPPMQIPKQTLPATQGFVPQSQRQPSAAHQARKDEIMSLDFQQRFFTGWGDDPHSSPFEQLKTPALGLTWTNQLDARIVLKISSAIDRRAAGTSQSEKDSYLWSSVKRRRHMKVVFAPWAAPSMDEGIEYELEMQGPVSVEPIGKHKRLEDEEFDADDDELEENEENGEHAELLDPKYWEGVEDDEFP